MLGRDLPTPAIFTLFLLWTPSRKTFFSNQPHPLNIEEKVFLSVPFQEDPRDEWFGIVCTGMLTTPNPLDSCHAMQSDLHPRSVRPPAVSLKGVEPCTLQRQFRLYIPFLGIARPQPHFPHSCICGHFVFAVHNMSLDFFHRLIVSSFLKRRRSTDPRQPLC